MAVLPTKDENTQKVLNVFSHLRSRPGHVLGVRNFIAVGSRMRWEMSDLQQGLESALERNLIREKNGGYELTEEGFAKMP